MKNNYWQLLETLVHLKNQWITFVGERLLDKQGKNITYWRVERSDSVIVIPILEEMIILPKPFYRHGVGYQTHDFPGGSHDADHDPMQTAYQVLQRYQF